MKQIKIHTIQEAKAIMPPLEILRIALMLKAGHTVTITDEQKQIEYVFEPQKGVVENGV